MSSLTSSLTSLLTSSPVPSPTSPPAPSLPAPAPPLAHPAPKLVLAAVVGLIGDRLLYGYAVGISLALFLALAAAAALVARVAHGPRPRGRDIVFGGLLLLAGLAPLVETIDLLSLAFGVSGLALAVAVIAGGSRPGLRAVLASARWIALAGPFGLFPAVWRVAGQAVEAAWVSRAAAFLGWLVPVVLCIVFAGLFALANPLIGAWLTDIPWSALVPSLNVPRTLLYVLLTAFAWAFIAPRVRAARPAAIGEGTSTAISGSAAAGASSGVLASATILRCLVLFNLLFAVQSASDIAYLWAGVALSPGVTLASYAHRGAYPLVATALLAAAFVLIALRPGGPGERSRRIRALVGLWIGQNVLLVLSVMLRLDLYVEAYGLTPLRLSALIWMALVTVGLALILARILLRRSNAWLVRANVGTLVLTLYACAFADFGGIATNYNAARSLLTKQRFDIDHALSLGVGAIPAIDLVLADETVPLAGRSDDAAHARSHLIAEQRKQMQDWRGWTFRSQRLLTYLDGHRDAPPPTR